MRSFIIVEDRLHLYMKILSINIVNKLMLRSEKRTRLKFGEISDTFFYSENRIWRQEVYLVGDVTGVDGCDDCGVVVVVTGLKRVKLFFNYKPIKIKS